MLIYNNCKMVYPKHSVIMVAMHIWNTYTCFCYKCTIKAILTKFYIQKDIFVFTSKIHACLHVIKTPSSVFDRTIGEFKT